MPALNECRSRIIRMVAKGDLSSAVLETIFEGESFIPHETELWDYKRVVGAEKVDLAELARDVISFHNSFGGYLLIGVDDDGEVVGSVEISSQQIRQTVKTYCGVDIKATSSMIQWKGYDICLIYVPKRDVYQSPCAISRQGPEISRGKVIFKPGDIYFRSDDSSQLIRGSDDLRFLIGDRQHSDEMRGDRSARVISNNLPDRGAIFSKFFGRDDVKESLWNWLADPFSKYRVVAGAGGVGKTSAIYSFCEDVCAEGPLGIEQVVWLSAKSRQFNAIEDRANRLPYQVGARQFGQSYNDFASLLDAISFHLAINDEEWDGCGTPAKKMWLSRVWCG